MTCKNKNSFGLGVILAAIIFIMDIVTPSSLDAWLFYLILLPLTARRLPEKKIYGLAAVSTLFVYLAYAVLSPPHHPSEIANRTLAALVIWLTAVILVRHRRAKRRAYEIDQNFRALKAEQALRESEEQYREFFELSAVGMSQTNPATGQFVRVNERMCQITGYSREELLSRSFLSLTHPDDREADWTEFKRMLDGETQEYVNEKRYIHKDGRLIWIYAAARAIRDEHGRPLRTVGVILDITERKGLERARADFVSMLTHDLKSPLTTIVGYADLLRGTAPDEGEADMVDAIRRNGDRMMRMVEDYLTVSKFNSGAFELSPMPEYLGHVLERLALDFSPAAESKGVRLETDIASGIPPVCVDLKYFERSVGNLVQNAINYTRPGGKVVVRARSGSREEGRRKGPYMAISVLDTGPGMPEEEKEKAFDKYYTRQKGMKGTGLGLAIVKAVAEAHGGRAAVDSEPGKGSAFHIYLPLKTDC